MCTRTRCPTSTTAGRWRRPAQTGSEIVIPQSFGRSASDYRPALYAWLAAIPQRFTGFSVAAGRLPAAVLGIASLILIYAFARDMAGYRYALLALLLAALSPLHIQLSRVAHEGGILPPFFLVVALYLWQRSARKDFPMGTVALLGLAIGFSANSYQSTRVTGPLLVIAVAIDIMRHANLKLRPLLLLGAGALLGALPQLLFLINETDRFMGRARALTVSTGGPLTYAGYFLHNYWLNLEPYYLFVPRVLRGLTVARLLPVEAPFFYAGLAALAFLAVRNRSRGRLYLYVAMVIAILPAALTTGNPSTMRASGLAVLTPLYSAAGIVLIGRLVRNAWLWQRIYYPAVVGAVVFAFAAMTYRYARSPYFQELSFQKIDVEMGRALGRHQGRYDAIVVEKSMPIPYIYIAAFAPIPPREFHRAPKALNSVGMDHFMRLGKYYFVRQSAMPATVDALGSRAGRFLFVSPRSIAGLTPLDSVSFGTQKLIFQACERACLLRTR